VASRWPGRLRFVASISRLPRRSAARCNPINAVSRLRLPGQSGSSPRTTPRVAPECSKRRVCKGRRITEFTSQLFGNNRGWADRDRASRTQRCCGRVDGRRACGIRCFPSCAPIRFDQRAKIDYSAVKDFQPTYRTLIPKCGYIPRTSAEKTAPKQRRRSF
jgi:hypothetical protein